MSIFEEYFIFFDQSPEESVFPCYDKKIIDIIEDFKSIFNIQHYLIYTKDIQYLEYLIKSSYKLLLVTQNKNEEFYINIERNISSNNVNINITPVFRNNHV